MERILVRLFRVKMRNFKSLQISFKYRFAKITRNLLESENQLEYIDIDVWISKAYVKKKKLTLSLEEKHIATMKRFAKKHDISVSQLISDYIEFLKSNEPEEPITNSLSGIFTGDVDEQDYKKYLEKKYLT
jgi:hypothetical protein